MTQVIVANRLNLIDEQTCKPLLSTLDELQKMTYNLQKSL